MLRLHPSMGIYRMYLTYTVFVEPCVDVTGAPASEWSRCQGSCCSARCSCVNVGGQPQAECQVLYVLHTEYRIAFMGYIEDVQ